MSKAELRTAMRSARRAFVAGLDPAERSSLEDALAKWLSPLVKAAKIVASYAPVGSEIDPSGATSALAGAALAYPAFQARESPMEFRFGPCTQASPFGGVQPAPGKTATPDLVLVPLIAIDPSGNRLGQGGGHYDRALPAFRASGAVLVGVGWAMQRLDFCIPRDEWDVPLDAFASPAGLENFE